MPSPEFASIQAQVFDTLAQAMSVTDGARWHHNGAALQRMRERASLGGGRLAISDTRVTAVSMERLS